MSRIISARALALALLAGAFLTTNDARADLAFGTPTKVPSPINSDATGDWAPSISSDGLTLYWVGGTGRTGFGNTDIWMAERNSPLDPWGAPSNLSSAVNTAGYENYPSISADGLELYFNRSATGTGGSHSDNDLWVSTRETKTDAWQPAIQLGLTVNDPASFDGQPFISPDRRTLYFSSHRPGGFGSGDLWTTTRPTIADPWTAPTNLGVPINSSRSDGTFVVTEDGLSSLYASSMEGRLTVFDLWGSSRDTTTDPWGTPQNLGTDINAMAYHFGPSIWAEGATLFYTAGFSLNEGLDIWQVSILPEPSMGDFDRSGFVDANDIDLLTAAIRDGSTDLVFDLDGSNAVDADDLTYMVETLLGTNFGDTDLSLSVTASGDGAILLSNLGQPGPFGWADGNFNGHVDMLVTASADGAILLANLGSDTAAVPEPGSLLLGALAALGLIAYSRALR